MRHYAHLLLPGLLAGLLATQSAHAAPAAENTQASSTAVAIYDKELAEVREAVEKQLRSRDPDIPVERVDRTDWDGVYMVVLTGGHVLYVRKDSQMILRGDMLQLEIDGSITNLTEQVRNTAVAARLKEIKPGDMISFKPKGDVKGVVYAFTDVDCGYCRKLHQEIQAMNDMGIELRYLAFPRGGERSPAFSKMVDAWCSKDRRQAITDLKNGKDIPSATVAAKKDGTSACAKLVEDQFQLGMSLGVNGTPALFLEDGRSIPGFRPAADLAQLMGITTPKALPAAVQ